jgi:dTDP-4-amino-4,6-dideoxygalactose transaminase
MIPFNKPYLTGKETHYIYDAVNSGKLSGNGNILKNVNFILKKNMVLKRYY